MFLQTPESQFSNDMQNLFSSEKRTRQVNNSSVLFLISPSKMLLQKRLDTRNVKLVVHFLDMSILDGSWYRLWYHYHLWSSPSSWISFDWQSSQGFHFSLPVNFPWICFVTAFCKTASLFCNDLLWLTLHKESAIVFPMIMGIRLRDSIYLYYINWFI